jgi:hypothetical protein
MDRCQGGLFGYLARTRRQRDWIKVEARGVGRKGRIRKEINGGRRDDCTWWKDGFVWWWEDAERRIFVAGASRECAAELGEDAG